jgi:hypothetical protein
MLVELGQALKALEVGQAWKFLRVPLPLEPDKKKDGTPLTAQRLLVFDWAIHLPLQESCGKRGRKENYIQDQPI